MPEFIYDYIFEILLQEGISNSGKLKDMFCDAVDEAVADIQEEKEQRRFEYVHILIGDNSDRVKEVIKKLEALEKEILAVQPQCAKVDMDMSEADKRLSAFIATLEPRG